jgi:hypothetical protein
MRDRTHADDAEPPEECFFIARTACSMSRGSRRRPSAQVLDRADDTARLPFERRLAPAVEPATSVSTLTKTQLRISALTTTVRIAVIFTDGFPGSEQAGIGAGAAADLVE